MLVLLRKLFFFMHGKRILRWLCSSVTRLRTLCWLTQVTLLALLPFWTLSFHYKKRWTFWGATSKTLPQITCSPRTCNFCCVRCIECVNSLVSLVSEDKLSYLPYVLRGVFMLGWCAQGGILGSVTTATALPAKARVDFTEATKKELLTPKDNLVLQFKVCIF